MYGRIEVTAEQLPEQLRPLLAAYLEAQAEAVETARALNCAPITTKRELKGPADDAEREAAEAHHKLVEATREQPGPMREYSNARFHTAVESAREHLTAAEAELRTAAGHAAVHASIRPGKPCVSPERGMESAGLKRAMFAVCVVRDSVSSLPEDID